MCQNDSCIDLFQNLTKIYLSRLLPGAITKNSINTKMTISQEPLVETDPALCQNVSSMKLFCTTNFGIRNCEVYIIWASGNS